MNVIEVKDLSKSFGEIKAVRGISFSVREGDLFAFLGENGAGKSTTINILCSTLRKDGGTVTIGGKDLDRDGDEVKASIGVVFQSSVLDAKLTVRENLLSRAALYGMKSGRMKQRVAELSATFELEELLDRRYGKLSGGQRRRVDIARALLNDPKILFLDEPTTGLDPHTRRMVWSIIDGLRLKFKLTVFLTTHYMEEAALADDVVILDEGNIVEHGTPDDLKRRLTSDALRILSAENPELEKLFTKQKLSFAYRNSGYEIAFPNCFDAADFAVSYRKLIPDFEVKKGGMDDVFLAVTGKKLEG